MVQRHAERLGGRSRVNLVNIILESFGWGKLPRPFFWGKFGGNFFYGKFLGEFLWGIWRLFGERGGSQLRGGPRPAKGYRDTRWGAGGPCGTDKSRHFVSTLGNVLKYKAFHPPSPPLVTTLVTIPPLLAPLLVHLPTGRQDTPRPRPISEM